MVNIDVKLSKENDVTHILIKLGYIFGFSLCGFLNELWSKLETEDKSSDDEIIKHGLYLKFDAEFNSLGYSSKRRGTNII